jgi:hypothetical protein
MNDEPKITPKMYQQMARTPRVNRVMHKIAVQGGRAPAEAALYLWGMQDGKWHAVLRFIRTTQDEHAILCDATLLVAHKDTSATVPNMRDVCDKCRAAMVAEIIEA